MPAFLSWDQLIAVPVQSEFLKSFSSNPVRNPKVKSDISWKVMLLLVLLLDQCLPLEIHKIIQIGRDLCRLFYLISISKQGKPQAGGLVPVHLTDFFKLESAQDFSACPVIVHLQEDHLFSFFLFLFIFPLYLLVRDSGKVIIHNIKFINKSTMQISYIHF